MTHDELLVKIRTGNEFAGIKYAPDSHTFALRKVVELHKPQVSSFDDTECAACSSDELSVIHPCATIQAIEKELA